MLQRDNMHYNFRKIDSYNKPFNFVISAREARIGKTTAFVLDKLWKAYLKGQTSLIIRRRINAISDEYLNSLILTIKMFTDLDIKLKYSKSSLKNGIMFVYIKEEHEEKLFFAICGLSTTIDKLKSLVIPNIKYIFFDEFICNKKYREKYLPDEVNIFKDIYNTFRRFENKDDPARCYFLGNPYSKFNPYFLAYGVPLEKVQRGTITVGINWAVECYDLTQELKDFILATNPLYQFDDSYTSFAFNGESVNDKNIFIRKTTPPCFSLWRVFFYNDQYIGIFKRNRGARPQGIDEIYHCRFVDKEKIAQNRDVFCFNLEDVVNNTIMWTAIDKAEFGLLKYYMQTGLTSYENESAFYLASDIFEFL